MKELIAEQQQSQGEELLVFTNIIKLLVTQEASNGNYAIFEESVPPLGGPPPHTHPDEEVFYVLNGEFEFILNDLGSPFKALPGSVIHVPSNALHTFKNVGQSAGKMIVIITPGQLEQYFRAVGQKLNLAHIRPEMNQAPDFSKLDVQKAFELAPLHHIEFVMPEVAK